VVPPVAGTGVLVVPEEQAASIKAINREFVFIRISIGGAFEELKGHCGTLSLTRQDPQRPQFRHGFSASSPSARRGAASAGL
jgi:hypothetical protein